uniref:MSP domain-containing protein n=1 Tax=Caenorhabditis tropicalis TaxID=1561998 RepID=A0A1I7T9B1_9PELO
MFLGYLDEISIKGGRGGRREKNLSFEEEEEMSLTADPPACTVPAAGGTSTHKLVNGGADKLIFKIKSSNNNEYRITPVFGYLSVQVQ